MRRREGKLAPAWRWNLANAAVCPKRSLCVQYQESDLDFVERLLREEGLFYWFEHAGDAASSRPNRESSISIANLKAPHHFGYLAAPWTTS